MNDYECEAQINRLKVGFLFGNGVKTITNSSSFRYMPAGWRIFEQQPLLAFSLHLTTF